MQSPLQDLDRIDYHPVYLAVIMSLARITGGQLASWSPRRASPYALLLFAGYHAVRPTMVVNWKTDVIADALVLAAQIREVDHGETAGRAAPRGTSRALVLRADARAPQVWSRY